MNIEDMKPVIKGLSKISLSAPSPIPAGREGEVSQVIINPAYGEDPVPFQQGLNELMVSILMASGVPLEEGELVFMDRLIYNTQYGNIVVAGIAGDGLTMDKFSRAVLAGSTLDCVEFLNRIMYIDIEETGMSTTDIRKFSYAYVRSLMYNSSRLIKDMPLVQIGLGILKSSQAEENEPSAVVTEPATAPSPPPVPASSPDSSSDANHGTILARNLFIGMNVALSESEINGLQATYRTESESRRAYRLSALVCEKSGLSSEQSLGMFAVLEQLFVAMNMKPATREVNRGKVSFQYPDDQQRLLHDTQSVLRFSRMVEKVAYYMRKLLPEGVYDREFLRGLEETVEEALKEHFEREYDDQIDFSL